MTQLTAKSLKSITREGYATNLSNASPEQIETLREYEGHFNTVAYSSGLYGVSGKLYQGAKSGHFYTVIGYSSNLYRI